MAQTKPLGLGLVGCGAFGQFCLRAFGQMDQVRIAAVADICEQAAQRFAVQFKVPAHSDPRQLIARDDVDIVHVATPPSTHHELALAAARAGKHVLCEKPLATRLADAEEMLAAARQAATLLPVNFILRYNAVTEAVKAVIDSGAVGKVLAGRLTNCAADSNLSPEHWFWNQDLSGGIFIEHGVHFFDLYRYWLGPGRVISSHVEVREATGQEDRVTCVVRHDCGAVVSHYHGFDQVAPMDRTDHRLVCELGDIRVWGWIPLIVEVDAVVSKESQTRLQACLPGAEMEMEEFTHGEGRTTGRGRSRDLARRIRLRLTPNADKQAVYAAGVRALLADQIAAIGDPNHQRRVAEHNGRDALQLAEDASQKAR